MLMLHFGLRKKTVETLGQAQTARLEDQIVERLLKAYPDLAGPWPPA